MGKTATTIPSLPPEKPRKTEPPVRTMSIEETKRLSRKVAKEHAELFRRLAQ